MLVLDSGPRQRQIGHSAQYLVVRREVERSHDLSDHGLMDPIISRCGPCLFRRISRPLPKSLAKASDSLLAIASVIRRTEYVPLQFSEYFSPFYASKTGATTIKDDIEPTSTHLIDILFARIVMNNQSASQRDERHLVRGKYNVRVY